MVICLQRVVQCLHNLSKLSPWEVQFLLDCRSLLERGGTLPYSDMNTLESLWSRVYIPRVRVYPKES